MGQFSDAEQIRTIERCPPSSLPTTTSTWEPGFCLNGYRELLGRLRDLDYRLERASSVGRVKGRVVFLRHDIDLHVEGADLMGAAEAEMGAASTWYVLTGAHYNLLYGRNIDTIRWLLRTGHDIGLHYDLGRYPPGMEAYCLKEEMALLSDMLHVEVASVAMHRPAFGRPDPLRAHPLNPHRTDIFYVSDSRREWTEPFLSTLLSGEPEQAMLCTHHEHWMSPEGTPRFDHLDGLVHELARRPVDESLADERAAWIRGR